MNKLLVVLLLLAALGLGGGLYYRHNNAVQEKKKDQAAITELSKSWTETKEELESQRRVNSTLETNLLIKAQEARLYSNSLAKTEQELAKLEAASKEAAQTAQAEMAKRDARIAELEGERSDLTKRMTELNTSITNLESQIGETERKLAASEGDREFLLKELKRLQSEKAELERQFNDLAILREQVKKLKDELSIARRLDWIRRGIYGVMNMKGGERLQKGFTRVPPPASTNLDLNVEIRREGGVTVNPPGPATNAPGTNTALPNPPPAPPARPQ